MSKSIVIASLLAVLCCAPSAWPQAVMETVSGTVRDQTGSVIPNTQVVITNTETVQPGSYRLTADVPSMQKFEGAFTVQVGQSAVVYPVLNAGQVTTQVEVKDVTPVSTANHGTVGTDLERSRIEQMPINGRSMDNLLDKMRAEQALVFVTGKGPY